MNWIGTNKCKITPMVNGNSIYLLQLESFFIGIFIYFIFQSHQETFKPSHLQSTYLPSFDFCSSFLAMFWRHSSDFLSFFYLTHWSSWKNFALYLYVWIQILIQELFQMYKLIFVFINACSCSSKIYFSLMPTHSVIFANKDKRLVLTSRRPKLVCYLMITRRKRNKGNYFLLLYPFLMKSLFYSIKK